MNNRKRLIVRIAAILVIILLSILLYHTGKIHSILIDNNNISIEGKEYKALDIVEFSIDGQEPEELTKKSRGQSDDVKGQVHTIKVVYTDKSWNEYEIVEKFRVPVNANMMIIYLPVLVSEPDNDNLWVEPFSVGE